MLKRYLSFIFFIFIGFYGFSQEANNPSKLKYTIQVDGLTTQEQATALDNALKQKTGILSDEIRLESKTVIVTVIETVSYNDVSDVLLSQGLKAQSYIVTQDN